ncbi:MAG: PrsW family intramembrane metalloprotease [Bacteroidetes bacterium]|nr:MAG: PrsW family intramembrane metalloprotease [Bacteroidota bacterium]
MRPLVYITLGFAPVIAGILYIYFARRNDKEFNSLLVKSFLLGMLGVLVLLAAQYISSLLGLNELRNLKRTLFYSFVTIGFASELGMYVIYRYLIIPREPINRPIHGITFSIMVALGFGTIRILLFILDPLGIRSLFPETLYAFVFVPANLMFAVIMGFYVGMAKFLKSRFVYNMTGLFAAAFFHGLFNFCLLTKDFKLLSLFAFGSTVIVFILGIKAAYTKPEPLDKI